MTDQNKSVFISYRRSTSKHLARSIFMDLKVNGWDAFFDVNTIDNGEFDQIILNQIAARAHFVLVLSPGSLERCQNTDDWLRREMEEALRLNRNIVPIIEEGFDMNAEKRFLPPHLSRMTAMNGIPLYHFYFDAAMQTLRDRYLKVAFRGQIYSASDVEEEIVQRKLEEASQMPVDASQLTAADFLNRGLDKYNRGDYDGALEDYEESLKINPNYALAFNNRGVVRKAQGDLQAAFDDYNIAIRLNPTDPDAIYNRGIIYNDWQDYERAIADYTEAIRLRPDYVKALINRGNSKHSAKMYESAIEDYLEAARHDPSHPDPHWGLGNVYYDQRRFDDALTAYQRYVDIAGSKANPFVVGRVKELKNKNALGSEMTAQEYFNRANEIYDTKDYAASIRDYTEAIRLNPEYTFAYNNRGNAHKNNGDLDAAIADYNQALRYNPNYALAYYNRAIAKKQKGDTRGAIADYTEAIRIDAKNEDAYYNRGLAYKSLGDSDAALKDYDEVIRINPNYAEAFNSRANVLKDKGQLDDAIRDYDRAIALEMPTIDIPYYNRADAWKRKGEFQKAIDDYQKYVDLGGGKRDGDEAQVLEWIADLKTKL